MIPQSALGANLGRRIVDIDKRRILSFAAGIGSAAPIYLDDARPGGIVAPPTFTVALEWPMLMSPAYLGAIGRDETSAFDDLVHLGFTLLAGRTRHAVRGYAAGKHRHSTRAIEYPHRVRPHLEPAPYRADQPLPLLCAATRFTRMVIPGTTVVLEHAPPDQDGMIAFAVHNCASEVALGHELAVLA
nr:MaoC family dehydratase N-terminal domain-containing protein [uncultured Rhodopila sp.]